MSSSQTVLFDNPSSILQLQNNQGLTVRMNETVAQANMLAWANSTLIATSGTLSGQDANGVAYKGLFCAYGNAFSGQDGYVTSGVARKDGGLFSRDSFVSSASCAKLIHGVILSKMLEEGLLKLQDTIVTYIPQFTGTYYYVTSATGPIGTIPTSSTIPYVATPPDFSLWTGTFGTVSGGLQTLTLANAVACQICLPYDITMFGKNFYDTTTYAVGDFPFQMSVYMVKEALTKGLIVGAASAVTSTNALRCKYIDNYFGDFSAVTGPYTDFVSTAINCIRSGATPLAAKVGEVFVNDNDIALPKTAYSMFCWALSSFCCAKAAANAGYGAGPNAVSSNPYIDFARRKIFAPMGITINDLFFEGIETAPSNYESTRAEQQFRRYFFGCT